MIAVLDPTDRLINTRRETTPKPMCIVVLKARDQFVVPMSHDEFVSIWKAKKQSTLTFVTPSSKRQTTIAMKDVCAVQEYSEKELHEKEEKLADMLLEKGQEINKLERRISAYDDSEEWLLLKLAMWRFLTGVSLIAIGLLVYILIAHKVW